MRSGWAAFTDLLLGSCCAGCRAEPGLLCDGCRAELNSPAALSVLADCGVGVACVGPYAGVIRSIVVEHKERGRLALARPLGDALAIAVTGVQAAGGSDSGRGGCNQCGCRPLCLVPAPSSPSATRARGHDPLLRITRRAATILRRTGQPAFSLPALAHVRTVADQADLNREQRQRNLQGSMVVRAGAQPQLAGRCLVVVDDIMTTGATLREAVNALSSAGHLVCGAAVVAATP